MLFFFFKNFKNFKNLQLTIPQSSSIKLFILNKLVFNVFIPSACVFKEVKLSGSLNYLVVNFFRHCNYNIFYYYLQKFSYWKYDNSSYYLNLLILFSFKFSYSMVFFKKMKKKKIFWKNILKNNLDFKGKSLMFNKIPLNFNVLNIFLYNYKFIFLKLFKHSNYLNPSILKKKNFLYIYINLFFINFIKMYFNIQYNLIITNNYSLPLFLLKKISRFLQKNKKYLKVLKNFKYFKNFFYILILTLVYKDTMFFLNFIKKFISSISVKKHKYMYYFLRFNITKVFKKTFNLFNVIGFFFKIKGKFATLGGGRKKIFYCKFKKSTATNLNYLYYYGKKSTTTKLGAADIKVLVLFI